MNKSVNTFEITIKNNKYTSRPETYIETQKA